MKGKSSTKRIKTKICQKYKFIVSVNSFDTNQSLTKFNTSKKKTPWS